MTGFDFMIKQLDYHVQTLEMILNLKNEGKSNEEISEIVGVSLAEVKRTRPKHLSEAKEKLSQYKGVDNMKNNPYDGLNYEPSKYNPVRDFAKWYEDNGKSKPNNEAASDSAEALRQRYQKDPSSMSPIELLSLGMYELNAKNEAQSQEQQRKANEFRQANEQQSKEDKELISTKSEEYQQLVRNLTDIQNAFDEMNGGGVS
ncbi:hypothetical protein [Priestia flexa]|uniref:hypothetical protein n=1 Tax=Priestia flexa TaxID=86664 RepID=UPI00099B5F5F|nr:hypothetical protein [Priestia flexa]AQX56044.1 hypothetical protein BC359_18190 [Priestia flexa]